MGRGMQVSHEETKEAILKAGVLQNICGTDCSASSDCSGGISAYFRKKYKEQAVENIESVQKTVVAGLLSDADFMSVHAPVTDYQCEQQHDNAVCGGSGQRQ